MNAKQDEVQQRQTLPDGERSQFFDILTANVVRARITIAVMLITIVNPRAISDKDAGRVDEEATSFLQSSIRQTDLLFRLPGTFEWCLILSQSGEDEAAAFFRRLMAKAKHRDHDLFRSGNIQLSASIAEIGNNRVVFEELLERCGRALSRTGSEGAWQIEFVHDYKEKQSETVKVSILEEDAIFRHVLRKTIEGLDTPLFQLDIQTFPDGYEFLQSDWFASSHTHIVIMNDILPRKNGLEVLHAIRKLPNNKKFIIFMMTKKRPEEDMIYAYESGVDEYLVKPFNLRLFSAQMKRKLDRLWS